MSDDDAAGDTGRGRAAKVLAVVVVCAAAIGALARCVPADSEPLMSPAPSVASERLVSQQPGQRHGQHPGVPGGPGRGSLPGLVDGVVPDGTTVFDSGLPAVENLEPELLRVLRQAAVDASREGVTFYVDSGWRSLRYQTQLFRDAVAKYGSPGEAARWVAPPGTSAHEVGEAVDLGHEDAVAWLSAHGAAYGLCQIYGNETWHYERRPTAVSGGCPPQYADATFDPRTNP